MPTNKKYNLQTYNSGLRKLEAQVGRASTPQKRKKAKAAIAAYRKTRSKYTANVKNPADKAVRNIASQVKAKARPGIKKVKRAVSAVKKRSQRVSDSGPTQKRLTIQKLTKQLRSLRVNDPKREAVRKKLAGARSSPASVFARARAESPTKKVAKKKVAKKKVAKKKGNSRIPISPQVKLQLAKQKMKTMLGKVRKKVAKKKGTSDNLKKALPRGGVIHRRVRDSGIRAGRAMSSAGSPPPPSSKKKVAKKKVAKKKVVKKAKRSTFYTRYKL